MRREDFAETATGQLVVAPQGHLAFVPNPLPPHLKLSHATIGLLANAERAVGELNGVGRRGLPNPHLLTTPLLRQEAVLSSRIEGTKADLQDLLMFEAAPTLAPAHADVREVANYVAALEHGFSLLERMPISSRLLREVHARLMENGRGADKRPGEFRQIPVMIGGPGATLAKARFVPPPVMEMGEALHDLERYIGERPDDLPFLIQLALVHYQFEAIHPFVDGNGRLGRLLIALQLKEREYLAQPLLYVSAYFERNRNAYLGHLFDVSRQGAWIPWIDFFLRGVTEQARDAIQKSDQILGLRERYRTWALAESRSGNLVQLVDFLFERPVIAVADVETHLDVTRRAASQLVQRLVSQGMLAEITGRQRNRQFAAQEIIAILNAPAQ